jgi:hypothetical protein
LIDRSIYIYIYRGDGEFSAEAAHRLGEIYFFGDAAAGVAPDAAEALRYIIYIISIYNIYI